MEPVMGARWVGDGRRRQPGEHLRSAACTLSTPSCHIDIITFNVMSGGLSLSIRPSPSLSVVFCRSSFAVLPREPKKRPFWSHRRSRVEYHFVVYPLEWYMNLSVDLETTDVFHPWNAIVCFLVWFVGGVS